MEAFGKGKRFPGAPQTHRAVGGGDSLGHNLAMTRGLGVTHLTAWPGFLGSPWEHVVSEGLKSGPACQRDSHAPTPQWPEGVSAKATTSTQGLRAQLVHWPFLLPQLEHFGQTARWALAHEQGPGGLFPASSRLACTRVPWVPPLEGSH